MRAGDAVEVGALAVELAVELIGPGVVGIPVHALAIKGEPGILAGIGLGGTEELEKERADLEIERNLLADRLQALIDRNAKEAQDQVKYIKQYDELSGKYKKAEEKLTRLDTRIRDKEMRNRRIADFIDAVEQMPDTVSEFSTELWATLIDQVTVYGKKDVRFTLSTGEEIQVD